MLRVFQLHSNKIDERDTRLIANADFKPKIINKNDLINISKEAFLNDKANAKIIKKMMQLKMQKNLIQNSNK